MKEVVRNLIVLSLLFFIGTPVARTEEELDHSQEVLKFFFDLFSDVGFGYDPIESAGWITHVEEGYKLRKWPRSEEKSKQAWKGLVPVDVVAIAHTHPSSDIQKPSMQDIEMAKKLNVDVYTICRAGIWKTTPDGVTSKIRPRNWFIELKANASNSKN